MAKFTTWGRQFWYVTGAYFTGRHSVRPWLSLAALLLSVIIGVRLSVLFSYQTNDLYTAAQTAVQGMATGNETVKESGIQGFWLSLVIFSVLAAILVTRVLVDLFITQRFMLAWRMWLTDRLTGDWLDGRAYYRGRFIDATIDNPDQRIQSDIDVFTALSGPQPNTPHQTSNGTLPFGAISAIVSVASFAGILWNLSGELSLFGFELPRAHVLDRVRIRGVGLRHRVLAGRPLIRLQLQQREVQRRIPVRAGAIARCRRIGCLVPRREGRATSAARAVRAGGVQLQAVHRQDAGVHRLELVDEPRHHSVALDIAGAPALHRPDPASAVTQIGDGVRRHPGRIVVLPQLL